MLRTFFSYRNNFAPNGPGLGERGEQKRPVGQKNRGILGTWRVFVWFADLFSLSSGKYWIFRRGAQTGDLSFHGTKTLSFFSDYETVAKAFPGRTNGSPLRKKYSFISSGYETVAKFLGGERERPFSKTPRPFGQEISQVE